MQRLILVSFIFFGLAVGSASAARHNYNPSGKSMHHHHQRYGGANHHKQMAHKSHKTR
jgi:hypothetical protein